MSTTTTSNTATAHGKTVTIRKLKLSESTLDQLKEIVAISFKEAGKRRAAINARIREVYQEFEVDTPARLDKGITALKVCREMLRKLDEQYGEAIPPSIRDHLNSLRVGAIKQRREKMVKKKRAINAALAPTQAEANAVGEEHWLLERLGDLLKNGRRPIYWNTKELYSRMTASLNIEDVQNAPKLIERYFDSSGAPATERVPGGFTMVMKTDAPTLVLLPRDDSVFDDKKILSLHPGFQADVVMGGRASANVRKLTTKHIGAYGAKGCVVGEHIGVVKEMSEDGSEKAFECYAVKDGNTAIGLENITIFPDPSHYVLSGAEQKPDRTKFDESVEIEIRKAVADEASATPGAKKTSGKKKAAAAVSYESDEDDESDLGVTKGKPIRVPPASVEFKKKDGADGQLPSVGKKKKAAAAVEFTSHDNRAHAKTKVAAAVVPPPPEPVEEDEEEEEEEEDEEAGDDMEVDGEEEEEDDDDE